MSFSIKLRIDRFKSMPMKCVALCVLIAFISTILFLNLFHTPKRYLQNIQLTNLHVDQIYREYGYGRHYSDTIRYIIISNDTKYYVLFPNYLFNEELRTFLNDRLNNLQGESSITITATIATKQTFVDCLHRQQQILAFSVDGAEYLNVQTSKEIIEGYYIGALVGYLLIGTLCNAALFITLFSCGVLQIRKKNNGTRKKTADGSEKTGDGLREPF